MNSQHVVKALTGLNNKDFINKLACASTVSSLQVKI
jgi:hypothetical protein